MLYCSYQFTTRGGYLNGKRKNGKNCLFVPLHQGQSDGGLAERAGKPDRLAGSADQDGSQQVRQRRSANAAGQVGDGARRFRCRIRKEKVKENQSVFKRGLADFLSYID